MMNKIPVLNKHGASITDFSFCLRLHYGSAQHVTRIFVLRIPFRFGASISLYSVPI